MSEKVDTIRTKMQLLVFRWFLAPRCSRIRPNTLKYRGLLEDTRISQCVSMLKVKTWI